MARKNLQFEINPLLTGPTLQARTLSGSPYRELNIGDIDVDPEQPRRVFDDESLQALAASIREHGLLCPILVRVTAGGSYRLIAGERRLRASKLLGRNTVPAIVEGEETSDVLAKQLVENIQREDLNPLERAFAIGRLRDRQKLSIRDIAAQLGVTKAFVQRSLEILALPEDLQAALAEGAAESKILLLRDIGDPRARKTYLEKLDQMTRSELEAEILKWNAGKVYHGGTPLVGRHRKTLSTDDRRVVEELQSVLGTKVHLTRSTREKHRGKLVLEFYTDDDLREICARLTAETSASRNST